MTSSFDPTWYLHEYPDVADAQMDPNTHYALHGRQEGRFPRALTARGLEDKLWGGFSKLAEMDLRLLLQKRDTPRDESCYASWALARWYATINDWTKVCNALKNLDSDIPKFISREGVDILKLQAFYFLNDEAALGSAIKTYKISGKLDNSMQLMLAGVDSCQHCTGQSEQQCTKLDAINSVYQKAGISAITTAQAHLPTSIDNLSSDGHFHIQEDQAKVSIIMPAYNAGHFIQTAIRSVLAQTWKNLELLIVDDFSTDDTIEAVQKLQEKDSRIKLIRHTYTQGAYRARNSALQHSTGSFITNHDADDWSHPQRLALMMECIQSNDYQVAVVADWVRTNRDLCFTAPVFANTLIEPSVSTILFKQSIIKDIGGWDNVRVAADSELLERIQILYGNHSVGHALPGTPLVFARHTESSLTNASKTHWKTNYFGLRKNYRQSYSIWHKSVCDNSELCIKPEDIRKFPSPPGNLYDPVTLKYDAIIMGSFSNSQKDQSETRQLITKLLGDGKLIGLFHWPDYSAKQLEDISDYYLELSNQGMLRIVDSSEHLQTGTCLVLGSSYLALPLDNLPSIQFNQCLVKPPIIAYEAICKTFNDSDDFNTIQQSSVFRSEWYLSKNVDVKKNEQHPLTHYLNHGLDEGRSPNPDFVEELYLQAFPALKSTQFPPFLHYVKIGRHLGYDLHDSELAGKREKLQDRPTILVTAHAASKMIFGAERCLLDVLNTLTDLKFNVIVTVPTISNEDYIDELKRLTSKIIIIPSTSWHAANDIDSWSLGRFKQTIDNEGIDFVLANTIMQREPILAAKQKKIPNAVYAHESPLHDLDLCSAIGLSAEQIIQEIGSLAERLFVTSQYAANNFAHYKSAHILSNVIDAKRFDQANAISTSKITFGLISSNIEKKGILDLVQIAKTVEKTSANAHFLVVGPETSIIRSLKKQKSDGIIGENLSFTEYVADSFSAISQINVVLSLSHCQETFGRTVLEALAARRPVIAYAWGGIPELVTNDISGYLITPLDLNAVAERINYLCNSPTEIKRLGSNGRKDVIKRFSPRTMRAQLAHALCESPHRPDLSSQKIRSGKMLKTSR